MARICSRNKKGCSDDEKTNEENHEDGMLGKCDDYIDYKYAASFLQSDFGKLIDAHSKRQKKKMDTGDKTAKYEGFFRKWNDSEDRSLYSNQLMIREKSGKWINPKSDLEIVSDDSAEATPVISVPEYTDPGPSYEDLVLKLSEIARCVAENSEENVSKLRHLSNYYRSKDKRIKTLGLATTVALFKDILPSYPIRALTESEKAINVSKEVKKMRHYEQILLDAYSEFITFCKSRFSKRSDILSFKAMCELLKSSCARSFNFSDSMLCIISSAAAGNDSTKIRRLGCATLKSIFETSEDQEDRFTLLCLKSISKVLREKSFKVKDEELFEALESVRLKSIESITSTSFESHAKGNSDKTKSQLSKRKRKELKEEMKLSRKKAHEATAGQLEQHRKWAREIREQLFGVLFGFLKAQKEDKNEVLLGLCVRTITKFSPFIGVEYFADLTGLIKSLINGVCSPFTSLSLIISAARMSDCQEFYSSLDLKYYYNQFYALFKKPQHLAEHPALTKEAFSLLFMKKQSLPKDRVASFAHRILKAAVDSSPDNRMFFSSMLCDLSSEYPFMRSLFEEEPFGNGVYLEQCDDPDISRPFCKSLDLSPLLDDPRHGQAIRKSLMSTK